MKKYLIAPDGSSNFIIIDENYVVHDGFTLSDFAPAPAPTPPYDLFPLEQAYKAIVERSVCSLQSQTAWIGAFVTGDPINASKVGECKAWLNALWAQYQVDKANELSEPSFNAPQPPYSFMETMTP